MPFGSFPGVTLGAPSTTTPTPPVDTGGSGTGGGGTTTTTVDAYTKTESDAKYRTIADSQTKAESDARYRLIVDSFNQTDCTDRFRLNTDSFSKSEIQSTFLDKLNAASLYRSIAASYTKDETSSTFLDRVGAALVYRAVADSYNRTECDSKYRTIANSYTKTDVYTRAECDALFVKKTDAPTVPVVPVVISTTSGMISDDASVWFEGALNNQWGGLRVHKLVPGSYTMDSQNAFPALYFDLSLLTLPGQVGTYNIRGTGDVNRFVRINMKFASTRKLNLRNKDDANYLPFFYGTDNKVRILPKFVLMQYTNSTGIDIEILANGDCTISGSLVDDFSLALVLSLKPDMYSTFAGSYRGWKLSELLELCNTDTSDTGCSVLSMDTTNPTLYTTLYVDIQDTWNKVVNLNENRKFRMTGFRNNFHVFVKTKHPASTAPDLTVLNNDGSLYTTVVSTAENANQLVLCVKDGKEPYVGLTDIVTFFFQFNLWPTPSVFQIKPSTAWQEAFI